MIVLGTADTIGSLTRKIAFLFTSMVTVLLFGVMAGGVMALTVAGPAQATPSSAKNGKLAFSRVTHGRLTIYLMDPDGSNGTRFTTDMMQASAPAISPDGKQIAFVGNKGDYNDIYVMDTTDRDGDGNGDHLRRLTNDWANDDSPTWSPDGKKIAFSSDIEDGDDEQESDIYVMNADGSNRTNLTTRPGEGPDSAGEQFPAFSPDGRKIAYASSRDFREDGLWSEALEIYVMNADGSNETRLSDNGGYAPAYSPDGTKIIFANPTYLFNENGMRYDENGMPDENGRRYPYAEAVDIYAMNANGSNEIRLTHTTSAIDKPDEGPRTYTEVHAHPAVSPDGRRIAFGESVREYDETGTQESFRRSLYSMDADGTDLITIANHLGVADPPQVDWGPKPNSVAPANEATEAQETTAVERSTSAEKTAAPVRSTGMDHLAPSGGPNLQLPAAVLLLGAGVLGYAALRSI